MQKIDLQDEEIETIIKSLDKKYYNSNFDFLKAHNGFVPNKFYVFLATSGGGKSTLRNSLIFDFVRCNSGKRVFLWLSEEKISDFKADIVRNKLDAKLLNGTVVFSEQDNYKEFENQNLCDYMCHKIVQSNCDIFIYDNITTSKLYGHTPSEQTKFTDKLKAELQALDIPTIIFAHTSSEIKASSYRLIEESDIRGSRNLPNLAEFFYTLQNFTVGEKRVSFIRIIKHRGRNVTGNFFALKYDFKTRLYELDHKVEFEMFNQFYKTQNKLGK